MNHINIVIIVNSWISGEALFDLMTLYKSLEEARVKEDTLIHLPYVTLRLLWLKCSAWAGLSSRNRTSGQTVHPSILGRRFTKRKGKWALQRAVHHCNLPESVYCLSPTTNPLFTCTSGNQSDRHAHLTCLRLSKVGVCVYVYSFKSTLLL